MRTDPLNQTHMTRETPFGAPRPMTRDRLNQLQSEIDPVAWVNVQNARWACHPGVPTTISGISALALNDLFEREGVPDRVPDDGKTYTVEIAPPPRE